MRSLARFILSGPFQAIAVVYAFALLSFPFPFLIIFSGGALALITLQEGIRQGIKVLLGCLLLITVSTFFVFGSVTTGPLIAWLPVVILALVYRNTQSLNLTLQLLTIFGVIVTVLIAIMFPDIQTHWLNYLQSLIDAVKKDPQFQEMFQNSKLNTDIVKQYLPIIASVMTGGLVSLFMLTMSLTLFLGRWWQSLQGYIVAFRKEFITIRLGKVLAGFTMLFVIAALVVKHAMFWQLAIVCLSMYSLQGMAIVHAIIGQLSSSMLGFVVVYGLLFIAAPQMIMALSTLGVLDTLINFRERFVKSKS